jgi:hypothetical protein
MSLASPRLHSRRYPRDFTFHVAKPISSIPDLGARPPAEAMSPSSRNVGPSQRYIRAALSEPEKSGGVHRPDPRGDNGQQYRAELEHRRARA